MRIRPVLLAASFPLLLTAYACSEDEPAAATNTPAGDDAGDDTTPTPGSDASVAEDAGVERQAIELKFEARVGSEKFECGKSYSGIGTTAATATAGDLRFFVHDVRLVRDDKSEVAVELDTVDLWQSPKVALLDFENKTGDCQFGTSAVNDVVRGKAPAGTYTGLVFTIGVPEALNHVNPDTAEAPLPGSGMNWDWTTGFIHFASQLNSTKTTEVDAGDGGVLNTRVPPFFSHIGSTVCSGDPADGGAAACQRKNRALVRLSAFDAKTKKIVVDAKKILATSNIDQNTPMTAPGCMSSPSDPECAPVFPHLGLDFATGGQSAGAPQDVFSVEAR